MFSERNVRRRQDASPLVKRAPESDVDFDGTNSTSIVFIRRLLGTRLWSRPSQRKKDVTKEAELHGIYNRFPNRRPSVLNDLGDIHANIDAMAYTR